MLSPSTIENLTSLKNDLKNLSWVNNVITVLDVPLLKNNGDPLSERIKNFKTLSSEDADKERGFDEIINSPIYKEFVISNDGKTSGILVYIKTDNKLSNLIKKKNNYLDKIDKKQLNSQEKKEYKEFLKEYDYYKKSYNQKNHKNINEIRSIIEKHKNTAMSYVWLSIRKRPNITESLQNHYQNKWIVSYVTYLLKENMVEN